MLCSIGLFDAEKMNQGIFGFRKYENSSLSYTGIDKHEGEAIGGWDTVLRREEYEALYSKQQATMTDFEQILIPDKYRNSHETAKSVQGVSEPAGDDIQKKIADKWEELLAGVEVGTVVSHKKFGDGDITWIRSDKKYMRVKFTVGEKQFVFPDAFINGFLEIK